MLVEQALHRSRAHEPAVARGRVEQHVAHELGRSSRSQRPIGTPKPVLPRAATSGGSVVGERSPERDLAGPALLLQVVRQREPELEHLPVEQRRPELERVRHRGEVGLHEQVVGQVRLDVEQLEAAEAWLPRRSEELSGGRRLDACLDELSPARRA